MIHKWRGVNVYLKPCLICLSQFSAHSLLCSTALVQPPFSLDFPCPKQPTIFFLPLISPVFPCDRLFALFSPLLRMLEPSIWSGEVLGLQKLALSAALRVGIAWPCPKRLSVTRAGAKAVIPIWQMQRILLCTKYTGIAL